MSCKKAAYQLKDDSALMALLNTDAVLKTFAGNFLLYGGLLAGSADGNLSGEERDYLIDALSPLYDMPEIMIQCMNSPQMAQDSMAETLEWLKEHGGEARIPLFQALSCIIAADDALDDREKAFMDEVAAGLGIDPEKGEEMVRRSFVSDME